MKNMIGKRGDEANKFDWGERGRDDETREVMFAVPKERIQVMVRGGV